MTTSPSAVAPTESMDIATKAKATIEMAIIVSTITETIALTITSTPRTAGMASAAQTAKETMSTNQRASTAIKVNQAGTMNTPEPIVLGFQSVLIIATLMPAMAITTSASTQLEACLLYTSPSPRDGLLSRMPSSA